TEELLAAVAVDKHVQVAASTRTGPCWRACEAINNSRKTLCCGLGALSTWRPRDVAVLINEIQEPIVAINRVFDQHLRFALARLALLANVAVAANEVEIVLVIPLQVELFYFLRHVSLIPLHFDSYDNRADAPTSVAA